MNYLACQNDAGLLREYHQHAFGSFLRYGGSLEIARRERACAKRLAKVAGLPLEQVRADLLTDAELEG